MHLTIRRAGLVTAVLAAGFTTLITTNASASPAAASTFPERDEVLIDKTGYDVAGDGFTNGVPDAPAILTWNYSSTFGTDPELDGKIHFDGASDCARVLLISYNDGQEMTDGRVTSDEECPATTDHYARNIELDGAGPLDAHVGADQVKVVLQTEPSPNRWVNAGSQMLTFGPELDVDPAHIYREEFKLGSGDFTDGRPEGDATVTWVVDEDSEMLSPRIVGTLYAINADDACVRMQVRYKDADGDVLETRDGTEHCLETDELTTFGVSMGGNYASYGVRQATYAILKDGVQIGATTVELGDPLLFDPPLEVDPNPLG